MSPSLKETPKNLKNFVVNCEKGNCVCEGFPNPNVKDSLLRGKVTLEQCRQACERRNLCFGFEFWSNHLDIDSANCFECPTFPGKTYAISVVRNIGDHNDWATVYTKNATSQNKKNRKGRYMYELVMRKFDNFFNFASYYYGFNFYFNVL